MQLFLGFVTAQPVALAVGQALRVFEVSDAERMLTRFDGRAAEYYQIVRLLQSQHQLICQAQ